MLFARVNLVETICNCRCGRLIDDAKDLEARNRARIFGGLALAIVEVRRHCNDSFLHRLAKVSLRSFLHLCQHHCADLFWMETQLLITAHHFNHRFTCIAFLHGEGPKLHVRLHSGVIELPAN